MLYTDVYMYINLSIYLSVSIYLSILQIFHSYKYLNLVFPHHFPKSHKLISSLKSLENSENSLKQIRYIFWGRIFFQKYLQWCHFLTNSQADGAKA